MSPTTSHSDRRRDEVAVRAAEAAYDAAWNSADLDTLVAQLTPDATIIDPLGGVSTGAEEVRRLLGDLLAGSGRGSTHTSVVLGVHFASGDVALADGEAVIEGLRGPDGGVRGPLVHRFTDILVRDGAAWRIAHTRAYVFMDGPRP